MKITKVKPNLSVDIHKMVSKVWLIRLNKVLVLWIHNCSSLVLEYLWLQGILLK